MTAATNPGMIYLETFKAGQWVWAFEYDATEAGLALAEARLAIWTGQGAQCRIRGPAALMANHSTTRAQLDALRAQKARARRHEAPPEGGLFAGPPSQLGLL